MKTILSWLAYGATGLTIGALVGAATMGFLNLFHLPF